jgi:hypothetical protein
VSANVQDFYGDIFIEQISSNNSIEDGQIYDEDE